MAHVNHSVYFTYLEVARTEYWFTMHGGPGGIDRFNFIVLKAQCHYRSPAVLGETVVVRNGITRMGNTSFTWEYELFDQASGRWIASASTEMVMYDYARKKPTRIPAELRERIEAWQQQLRDAT